MQILTLEPTAIRVKEGLDRFRKDMGEITKLADSLTKFGQLQPIGITRQSELVWGGRRLAACIFAGLKVKAIFNDEADPLLLREMELEENIQRKDFTPAESAIAVSEIHKLKQEIYGVATPGIKDSGWTLDKTAESLGVTRGNIIESLKIAEMVALFPELKTAKTKSEIKSTAKAIDKVNTALSCIRQHEITSAAQKAYTIFHQDAACFLASQPDNKFQVFLTDPPYGIDIQDTMMGVGGVTGGVNSSGIKFDDSKEAMEVGIDLLAKELFRITTHDAQGYIFVAPEFFYTIRNRFTRVGWAAYIKPMLWVKNSSGQANQPSMYPSSCYEMILFLRKHDARLVVEGKGDWIQCPPVIGEAKLHPNEKPLPLLLELLDRISLPGMNLIDPFMGSGASIEAGVKKKLFSTGCDKLLECYATSLSRLEKVK
jgi:DNA modification methylase